MSRNGFPPVAWWQAAKSIGPAPWPNASRTTWPTPASLSGLGRMIGGRASKASESRTWGCFGLAGPVGDGDRDANPVEASSQVGQEPQGWFVRPLDVIDR